MPTHGSESPAAGTVLVVDDDHAMLRYLRTLLEMHGYDVETATSGREALGRVQSGLSPDVVLLDINMPGMDGLETLQELLDYEPDLKVIMCSCVTDPRKTMAAFLIGAQDFIPKPFCHPDLLAALERSLQSLGATTAVRWEAVRDIC
ncbi:MAG TPA: response regulator [Terriglobales bacterium]|nr:response regulator [Terriglobales bacterium]